MPRNPSGTTSTQRKEDDDMNITYINKSFSPTAAQIALAGVAWEHKGCFGNIHVVAFIRSEDPSISPPEARSLVRLVDPTNY